MLSPAHIYHIAPRSEWEKALAKGWYAPDSLRSEGYIHCSTAGQLLATANRLFRDTPDLVVLCIDTDSAHAQIRYENLEGGTILYPHVYGPLVISSIRAIHEFPPEADGRFELPAGLSS
jgi:uncharacterized protein (DUF952 family)